MKGHPPRCPPQWRGDQQGDSSGFVLFLQKRNIFCSQMMVGGTSPCRGWQNPHVHSRATSRGLSGPSGPCLCPQHPGGCRHVPPAPARSSPGSLALRTLLCLLLFEKRGPTSAQSSDCSQKPPPKHLAEVSPVGQGRACSPTSQVDARLRSLPTLAVLPVPHPGLWNLGTSCL